MCICVYVYIPGCESEGSPLLLYPALERSRPLKRPSTCRSDARSGDSVVSGPAVSGPVRRVSGGV